MRIVKEVPSPKLHQPVTFDPGGAEFSLNVLNLLRLTVHVRVFLGLDDVLEHNVLLDLAQPHTSRTRGQQENTVVARVVASTSPALTSWPAGVCADAACSHL